MTPGSVWGHCGCSEPGRSQPWAGSCLSCPAHGPLDTGTQKWIGHPLEQFLTPKHLARSFLGVPSGISQPGEHRVEWIIVWESPTCNPPPEGESTEQKQSPDQSGNCHKSLNQVWNRTAMQPRDSDQGQAQQQNLLPNSHHPFFPTPCTASWFCHLDCCETFP